MPPGARFRQRTAATTLTGNGQAVVPADVALRASAAQQHVEGAALLVRELPAPRGSGCRRADRLAGAGLRCPAL